MESVTSENLFPVKNSLIGQALTSKVKNIKNFVFTITCSNTGEMNSSYSNDVTTSTGTINYPFVRSTTAEWEKIKSVTLKRDYTAVVITFRNRSGKNHYEWCNINKNTYIMVNGTRYTMTKAEGIKIAPEKTYFSYDGQEITFTLYFPPIPSSATSMDLIESPDSDWKFYGIKIR